MHRFWMRGVFGNVVKYYFKTKKEKTNSSTVKKLNRNFLPDVNAPLAPDTTTNGNQRILPSMSPQKKQNSDMAAVQSCQKSVCTAEGKETAKLKHDLWQDTDSTMPCKLDHAASVEFQANH
ncbi:hypothetical protein GOODEAATRI_009756 [Goodea atripinnis]|uniref:Uncharacterized protein n=1 Tax=Goodea atripinnis TaxID=208336 RepID=A0ABV0PCT4_9TELE